MPDLAPSLPQAGRCQCSGIRYEIRSQPVSLAACHCSECKRQSGTAFGMSLIVPREGFVLLAGTPSSWTRPADRGGSVECFFCPDCGTRIYHASTNMSLTYNVKPGTLDDPSWLEPRVHVFAARRLPWVQIPEGVPALEEGPPAAPPDA